MPGLCLRSVRRRLAVDAGRVTGSAASAPPGLVLQRSARKAARAELPAPPGCWLLTRSHLDSWSRVLALIE